MTFQKRRKKLVDRSLQLRMVGSFLAVGFMATLFQAMVVNNSILRLAQDKGQAGATLMEVAPSILIKTLAATFLLVAPLTVIIGVLITHRIAGPALSMRRYLEDVAANGAPSKPCALRRRDELQDVCSNLNCAIEALTQGPSSEAQPGPGVEQLEQAPSLLPQEPASSETYSDSSEAEA